MEFFQAESQDGELISAKNGAGAHCPVGQMTQNPKEKRKQNQMSNKTSYIFEGDVLPRLSSLTVTRQSIKHE